MTETRLQGLQPLFICLGPAKSATTWVHRQLESHPEVNCTTSKEIHYWRRNYHRGPEWYVAQFADSPAAKVHAEVAVSYLGCEEALARMRTDLFDVRFMISLRNPFERSYSAYWQKIREGTFHGSLAEAIETYPSIVGGSRYSDNVDQFFCYFPAHLLHVARYEQLVSDPLGYVQGIFKFAGVDGTYVPPALDSVVNAGRRYSSTDGALRRVEGMVKRLGLQRKHLIRLGMWRPLERYRGRLAAKRPIPSMTEQDFAVLEPYLIDDVRRLEETLEADFSAWLSPGSVAERE